jgi:hypothetical protein
LPQLIRLAPSSQKNLRLGIADVILWKNVARKVARLVTTGITCQLREHSPGAAPYTLQHSQNGILAPYDKPLPTFSFDLSRPSSTLLFSSTHLRQQHVSRRQPKPVHALLWSGESPASCLSDRLSVQQVLSTKQPISPSSMVLLARSLLIGTQHANFGSLLLRVWLAGC